MLGGEMAFSLADILSFPARQPQIRLLTRFSAADMGLRHVAGDTHGDKRAWDLEDKMEEPEEIFTSLREDTLCTLHDHTTG
jgi:hypothetical protein